MSYKDRYEKAKAKGSVKEQTFQIKSWSEPGDELIGQVLSIGTFKGGKFDTEVSQYIIDTDEGIISTVLGSNADAQIKDKVEIGNCVHIEYQGKISLDDGRSVNRFNISTFDPGKGKDA